MVNYRMIPAAWVLMNRRRNKDNFLVLKALDREAKKNRLILKPTKCMTDFELDAIGV